VAAQVLASVLFARGAMANISRDSMRVSFRGVDIPFAVDYSPPMLPDNASARRQTIHSRATLARPRAAAGGIRSTFFPAPEVHSILDGI
jgi:hypothetical protein